MQTGQLDAVRENLSGKQQATIEYGVGALAGGATRFVFGRDVIVAARAAFADAPDMFPAHLAVNMNDNPDAEDREGEQKRALAAMEDAAKVTGNWIAGTASTVGGGVATSAVAVGTGVASAAGTVTRPFRSVNIDGDGIPDEPQAFIRSRLSVAQLPVRRARSEGASQGCSNGKSANRRRASLRPAARKWSRSNPAQQRLFKCGKWWSSASTSEVASFPA